MLKRKILALLILCAIFLTGCGKVKLSTGLSKTTFAKIDGYKVGVDRVELLLSEEKFAYENTLDVNVWDEKLNDETAEEYVKNKVKDTVEHIQILKNMADDMKIELTSEEETKLKGLAQMYYEELPQEVKDEGRFTADTVEELYQDILLAEKVFYLVTDTVDTEVSADEARLINVQYIFFSIQDDSVDKNDTTAMEAYKKKKYADALGVMERIEKGEDFGNLAREYSDDTQFNLEFGRGQYSDVFENAAFELEVGQVSDIVESENGYYIIKCNNDNLESDYNKRSKEIVFSRRTKMFAEHYAEYIKGIECEFNDKYWSELSIKDLKSTSGKLYEVYKNAIISTQTQ